MTSRIGDPFLTDVRLARVENMVRIAVPRLPEEATLVCYVMERGRARVDGQERDDYPEFAVFAIVANDPGNPQLDMMEDAKTPYTWWKKWDFDYSHLTGYSDPAIFVFTEVALRFAARYRSRQLQRLTNAA